MEEKKKRKVIRKDHKIVDIYYSYRRRVKPISKKFVYISGADCVTMSYQDVSTTLFGQIIKLYIKKVKEAILLENYKFVMPARMGIIYPVKFKPKLLDKDGKLRKNKMYPDWAKTKKMWKNNPQTKIDKKVVYFDNKHSFGYVFRMHWNVWTCNIKNKRLYQFKPDQTLKTALSQVVMNPDLKVDFSLYEFRKKEEEKKLGYVKVI